VALRKWDLARSYGLKVGALLVVAGLIWLLFAIIRFVLWVLFGKGFGIP
jgi:hypothetical protein